MCPLSRCGEAPKLTEDWDAPSRCAGSGCAHQTAVREYLHGGRRDQAGGGARAHGTVHEYARAATHGTSVQQLRVRRRTALLATCASGDLGSTLSTCLPLQVRATKAEAGSGGFCPITPESGMAPLREVRSSHKAANVAHLLSIRFVSGRGCGQWIVTLASVLDSSGLVAAWPPPAQAAQLLTAAGDAHMYMIPSDRATLEHHSVAKEAVAVRPATHRHRSKFVTAWASDREGGC